MPFWGWMIAAAVLAIAEMALPGTFFFLFLAAAAVLAGMASLLLPSLGGQLAVFVAGAIVALLLAPKLARRLNTPEEPIRLNVDSLVGSVGVVEEAIDPIHHRGLVKVQGQQWRAIASEPIAAGEQVRVLRVEGTRLVVVPRVTWEQVLAQESDAVQEIRQRQGG